MTLDIPLIAAILGVVVVTVAGIALMVDAFLVRRYRRRLQRAMHAEHDRLLARLAEARKGGA